MDDKVYAIPNVQTPGMPMRITPEKCVGSNTCVESCRIDVLIANPHKGWPPIIFHPEECRDCGWCATDCPTSGAVQFNRPQPLKPRRRDKEPGKISRVR